MCGGTFSWSWQSLPSDGLSPRVRGNRSRPVSRSRQRRSIPACAGEPRRVAAAGVSPKVYPRVCGGTAANGPPPLHARGLSPRVRGNHHPQRADGGGQGSIPACAGEPGRHRSVTGRGRVYPRVCGGTGPKPIARPPLRGLSPRVRGNPSNSSGGVSRARSIPACAGEPGPAQPGNRTAPVYPRVCGGTPVPAVAVAQGLSPRVRGNPIRPKSLQSGPGSIPACAGEPTRRRIGPPSFRVYPRVCGGTTAAALPPTMPAGLSPRVRGNPIRPKSLQSGPGSIPACAGEPKNRFGASVPGQVYPRVCGGTRVVSGPSPRPPGLSPRVRGNPGGPCRRPKSLRSIPACAGEPIAAIAAPLRMKVYPRVCGGTVKDIHKPGQAYGLSPRVRGNLA